MEEESPSNRKLIPLLVDGIGRDGTTLLMQLLGTSPQIAFDRIYPYEFRYFSYLWEWTRVIERQQWDDAQWHSNLLVNPPAPHGLVGPIPWHERNLVGSPTGQSFSSQCFLRVWEEFSTRAAAATRVSLKSGDEPVIYYAEKHLAAQAVNLRGLLPVRIVPLIRDPRDTWLSTLAFQKRRGNFIDHALDEGETMEDFLRRFIGAQKRRMAWLVSLVEAGVTPVFRYEDLVNDPAGQTERLEQFLGVRLNSDTVLRQRAQHEHHMTAKNPEESVGRWRREMSEVDRELFAQGLAPELRVLGYALE